MGKKAILWDLVLIIACVLIGIIIGSIFSLFNVYGKAHSIISSIGQDSQDDDNIYQYCGNKTLTKTAYCLSTQVNKFYKYNKTPDYLDLSLQELKDRGGDCLDYAKLYKSSFDALGFSSRYIEFPIKGTLGHVFVLVYGEEGYCILDQDQIECSKYK